MIAGYNNHGYISICVNYLDIVAHRIVWKLITGNEPNKFIDHINGNRSDNRWCNLREATYSENATNRGFQKNNKSGFKGVCFYKRDETWQSEIAIGGKRRFLGRFKTPELAHEADCKAAEELHGEFKNTGEIK